MLLLIIFIITSIWYTYCMKAKIKSFPQLYIGDSLDRNRLMIIKHQLRHGKGNYFIITPSEKDDELLEIIESKFLISPLYKQRTFILGGVAGSKGEAGELVRRIAEDCNKKRGDLNLKEFISCGQFF